MNRITAWNKEGTLDTQYEVEQGLLRISQQGGVDYCLFAPLHYEKNYAYPLLVWLHGPGDDERQLQRVMPLVSMRNYVGVAPRGPVAQEHPPGAYCWEPTSEATEAAEHAVFECIELASDRFNIASDRVFVGGYQCGGTMALRIALEHPQMFAGALNLGGPFPTGNSPLRHLAQVRKLPLFLANGRDSQLFPVEAACEALRLFHVAGMSVTLRQYSCGDELNTQMLDDVDRWIMERVTGVVSNPEDQCSWRAGETN